MEEKIINKTLKNLENKEINIFNILKELFLDESLKNQYINEIRRFSVIWKLTNKILKESWIDDRCKVLAIWDIKYFWEINNKWEALVSNSLTNIKAQDLLWYDLSWTWIIKLRQTLFDYMNMYYCFDDSIDKENIINNIIPTYWATDWFTSILDTIKEIFQEKRINFIYPEASFLANIKIAENILWSDNVISIDKSSVSDFFIRENDIDDIQKSDDIVNIYYITPVWNPTWEKLNIDKLYKLFLYILNKDKNAFFIMDNVYVWLLKEEKSINLFFKIFVNDKLLNKIIFLESLSKTLWTTWIRLWWIWSTNTIILNSIKKNVILKKAWFSKILWEFCINLLSDLNKIYDFQEDVYDFFSKQRLAFLDDIKLNYFKYFDFDYIPKILDREGIYILLKIKENYSVEEIFEKTWIIWVKIVLSDWVYIRYAFWNVNYF